MNQNKFQTITNNIKAISKPQSFIKNMANNLMKDNVLQSGNNINIPTVTTTQGISASMTALIKVTTNNSCKCNSSPTSLQFINSGVGLTSANLNVVVTKLC